MYGTVAMAPGQEAAEQMERRRTPRFPCNGEGALAATLVGAAVRELLIRNISNGGIEAVLGQAAEPNKLLTIELFNRARNCWHLKTVRVVYALPHENDRWRVGCSFSFPLSDNELQQLLGSNSQ